MATKRRKKRIAPISPVWGYAMLAVVAAICGVLVFVALRH